VESHPACQAPRTCAQRPWARPYVHGGVQAHLPEDPGPQSTARRTINHAGADETQGQGGFHCDARQYAMLLQCAQARDMTPWNQWRASNPNVQVWLEGLPIQQTVLGGGHVSACAPDGCVLVGRYLRGAELDHVHMAGASLFQADLEGANLSFTDLRGADLRGAHLEGATLPSVNMQGAVARGASFHGADFYSLFEYASRLEGAALSAADLTDANLENAHLEDVDLQYADLRGARFSHAAVNGGTLIRDCKVDKSTDFTGVGLDGARVEPGLKQLLEYNVRRLRWRRWYGEGRWWLRVPKYIVRIFWFVSDYGRSAWRIAATFCLSALAFALVYWCCPCLLTGRGTGGDIHGFFDALCFSVVTMTGIQASPDNVWGQGLLVFQVILGYGLLGALVTRLAILFSAGGPSGKFTGRETPAGHLQTAKKVPRTEASSGAPVG